MNLLFLLRQACVFRVSRLCWICVEADICVRTHNQLSVTGTPGIGKSAFYLYFLERYMRENPTKTIVTAAFNRDRLLINCVIFKPNQEPQELSEIPWEGGYMHLYDGPQMTGPSDKRAQMIAFTSPNESWFGSVVKNFQHRKLYMPR